MWNMISERIPDMRVLMYTAAAFIIPYCMYKLNLKIHRIGDPPWKKEE